MEDRRRPGEQRPQLPLELRRRLIDVPSSLACGRRWEPLAYADESGTFVAVLGLVHSEQTVEIHNFAVDVRHQRQGVGAAVMAAVIDRCREAGPKRLELTHRSDNEAAAALYHRAGLSPTGEQRNGEPVLAIDL